eukprot:g7379.t1
MVPYQPMRKSRVLEGLLLLLAAGQALVAKRAAAAETTLPPLWATGPPKRTVLAQTAPAVARVAFPEAYEVEHELSPGAPGAVFTMFLGNVTAQRVPGALLESSLRTLLRWPGDVRVSSSAPAPAPLRTRLGALVDGCPMYRISGLTGDQSEKNGDYWRVSTLQNRDSLEHWQFGRPVFAHAQPHERRDYLYWGKLSHEREDDHGSARGKAWLISNKVGGSTVSLIGPGPCDARTGTCVNVEPSEVARWYKEIESYDKEWNMRHSFVRARQLSVECVPLESAIVEVRLIVGKCDDTDTDALRGLRERLLETLSKGGMTPNGSMLLRLLRRRGLPLDVQPMFSGIYDSKLSLRSCDPKLVMKLPPLAPVSTLAPHPGHTNVENVEPPVACRDKPKFARYCYNYQMLGWCETTVFRNRCPKTCGFCAKSRLIPVRRYGLRGSLLSGKSGGQLYKDVNGGAREARHWANWGAAWNGDHRFGARGVHHTGLHLHHIGHGLKTAPDAPIGPDTPMVAGKNGILVASSTNGGDAGAAQDAMNSASSVALP